MTLFFMFLTPLTSVVFVLFTLFFGFIVPRFCYDTLSAHAELYDRTLIWLIGTALIMLGMLISRVLERAYFDLRQNEYSLVSLLISGALMFSGGMLIPICFDLTPDRIQATQMIALLESIFLSKYSLPIFGFLLAFGIWPYAMGRGEKINRGLKAWDM